MSTHLQNADDDDPDVQVHCFRHVGLGKDELGVVRDDGEAGEDLEHEEAQTDQDGIPGLTSFSQKFEHYKMVILHYRSKSSRKPEKSIFSPDLW